MTRVTITKAMVSAVVAERPRSGRSARKSPNGSENAAAPVAPARKPRKVIAIWIVARNRPGSSTRRCAVRAGLFPSSASCERRCRLTVMSAISLAAKKPPTRMRMMTTNRSLMGPGCRWYWSRQAWAKLLMPPYGFRSAPDGTGAVSGGVAGGLAGDRGRAGRAAALELNRASRHADHLLARGDVAVHHRPSAGDGPLADRDRRHHEGIDADAGAIVDHGHMLGTSIEVGGDRAGADVHVLPHLSITEVAEMVLLRAGADAALLDLREVADAAAGADVGSRPKVGERPDLDVLGHARCLHHAGPDARARADAAVADVRMRADHRVLRDDGRALEDRPRLDAGVLADLDAGIDPRRRRVDDRHPVAHVHLGDAPSHPLLGRRERDAVVDADRLGRVVGDDKRRGPAVARGDTDQVGEIQLARRRRLDALNRIAQPGKVEQVGADVDLVDGPGRVVGKVGLLDDRGTAPPSPRRMRP